MNSFLSWPGWEPPVKLSYGVALCHEKNGDILCCRDAAVRIEAHRYGVRSDTGIYHGVVLQCFSNDSDICRAADI